MSMRQSLRTGDPTVSRGLWFKLERSERVTMETYVKAQDENGDECFIPFPVSEHEKRRQAFAAVEADIAAAYNKQDGAAFVDALRRMRELLVG